MADGVSVSFGMCSCGHAPMPPSRDRHSWAVLAGYGDCVSLVGPDGGPAETVPVPGETVEVALAYPFVGDLGKPVWATFDLPLAALNGYDERPEDLGGFRFVRLRLDALRSRPRSRDARATATVLDVLDPPALMRRPPSREELGAVDLVGLRPVVTACGPLRRIDLNFEGDLGSWALFHLGPRGTTLLAHARWDAHQNEFVAGHRPLSPVEVVRFGLDAKPPTASPRGRRAGTAGAFLTACLLLGAPAPAAAQDPAASARSVPARAGVALVPTEVPTVGCATRGQMGDVPAPKLPPTVKVSLPARVAGRLASYGMAGGMAVLAPVGWICAGFSGSDGLTLVVAPAGTDLAGDTTPKGPAVVRRLVDGGTSGRFRVAGVAARAFPAFAPFARSVAAEGEDAAIVFAPYPSDRLTRVGADTVLYTTPPRTEGLGTLNLAPSRTPVSGFARVTGDPRAPKLTYLAIRLDPVSELDDAAILAQALGSPSRTGTP